MNRGVESAVIDALTRLCADQRLFEGPIELEHSVVDDLGIDSLLLVDLMMLVEDVTGMRGFSIEDWVDEEALGGELRFTVGSLVTAIESHLAKSAQRPT